MGPLAEHLPGEDIPVSVQECRAHLGRQVFEVVRVLRVYVRVVGEFAGYEADLAAAIVGDDLAAVVRGLDVPRSGGTVPDPAWVGARSDAEHWDVPAPRAKTGF